MGLFDKIKDGFKKAANDIGKKAGHVTKQIKKEAYKAGDVIKDEATKAGDTIKDVGNIVGDEVKDFAYEAGDVIKDKVQDPNFQRTVANVGFTAAEILAPEFAPELMMGQMAVNAMIEANAKKDLPYETMLAAGTAYASGDFKKRGSSNLSMSERLGKLKDVAIEEGQKQVDVVKEKLSDEAKARYDRVSEKITKKLGFDPRNIQSTDDALRELKRQIDKNQRLQKMIDDMKSGRALENLTNKVTSEVKKEVNSQGNKILNDVLGKVNEKKSQVKKAVKKVKKKAKSAKSKMADVIKKVKQNQQRYRMSSSIMN